MPNIKHILERQKKEMEVLLYDFADNATDNEGMVDSKDSVDFKEKSKDIKDWHTASIKEILEGLVESESREKLEERAHLISRFTAAFIGLPYEYPLIITPGQAVWEDKK